MEVEEAIYEHPGVAEAAIVAAPALDALAEKYHDHRVRFVFLYTREANPGELRPAHANIDDKLANARAMAERFDIGRPMLVDDLDGTVHRAYGALPNMTYVVGRGGRIIYRADWTDARSVALVLEQMLYERERRRDRTRLTPYDVEWAPQRASHLEPFLDILLEVAGHRAVEEFRDAMGHTHGPVAARPIERWYTKARRSSV